MDQPLFESKGSSSLKERVWVETRKIWTTAFPTMIERAGFFGILVATQAFIGQISQLDMAAYALVQTFTVRFADGYWQFPCTVYYCFLKFVESL